MIPIGMGLAWAGYAVGFWGYCLVRGYNVSFTDLVNPVRYYTGPKATRPGTWPPKCCPPDTIIPNKSTIGRGVDCGTGPTTTKPATSTAKPGKS